MERGTLYRGLRIGVVTRSMNRSLYALSSRLIPKQWPRIRLVDTTAEGYLASIILDRRFDLIINIDEDAFIMNPQVLTQLIDHFIEFNYLNAGMPDGGVVPIRKHHPGVTNPFFNLLRTDLLRQLGHPKVDSEGVDRYVMPSDLPRHLLRGEFDFEPYEPYELLLLSIASESRTLWLDARQHQDSISTLLCSHFGEPFLVHTWYSREYFSNSIQRTRILDRAKEAAIAQRLPTRRPLMAYFHTLIAPIYRRCRAIARKAMRNLGRRKGR